jgi:HrpA-like RNA helicase
LIDLQVWYGLQVFILHSSLEPSEQYKIFKPCKNPNTYWKIILATNIAETSLTIDDVTHVVDTGYVKVLTYDANLSVRSLKEQFISRASAKQRCGRAGRVQQGHCWRLYSEEWFNDAERVSDFAVPEIKRVCLDELILTTLLLYTNGNDQTGGSSVTSMHGKPQEFLRQCPEPPSDEMVQTSINKLLAINAIRRVGSAQLALTPLGFHLAKLSVDVCIGKMLIMSTVLHMEEPMLTIAAMLTSCGSSKSPFMCPVDKDKQEEAYRAHCKFTRRRVASTNPSVSGEDHDNDDHSNAVLFSDHLAAVRVYAQWRQHYFKDLRAHKSHQQAKDPAANTKDISYSITKEFCKRNYLSHAVLMEMHKLRELFRRQLIDAKLLVPARAHSQAPLTSIPSAELPTANAPSSSDAAAMDQPTIAIDIDMFAIGGREVDEAEETAEFHVEIELDQTTGGGGGDSSIVVTVDIEDIEESDRDDSINVDIDVDIEINAASSSNARFFSSESQLSNIIRCCLCAGASSD